ncbi:hypothetical protein PRK78_006693 [Emydomyces testavorans]|uniref:Uncharacterized protein n=1 Tax=Emydomyces testavorans TaxID=2070801 RepID=A0AAF0DML6_9EURO|nr:hypothetical protein PRK78_006693 [Emydomyces testavorans]
MKFKRLSNSFNRTRAKNGMDASYPQYPPPPPDVLLSNREHYTGLIHKRKYLTPPGQKDNSLYSLYRLYEYIVLDENTELRNEIEYFWRNHAWAVCDIPDPKDKDPARYAVLSCIPHLLVLAFNNNIELGLPRDAPAIMTHEQVEECRRREKRWERAPDWVAKVPPLKETLKIPHKKKVYVEESDYTVLGDMNDPEASEVFREKNILMIRPHIYFI